MNQFDMFVKTLGSCNAFSFFFEVALLLTINIIVKSLFLKIYVNKKLDCSKIDIMGIKNIEKELLRRSVFLKSSSKNWFDKLINILSVRWHFFNNINNHNAKITIKTILLVFNLSLLFLIISNNFIEEPDIDMEKVIAVVIASVVATFWHLDTVFQRKWKHCADVAYKYIELDLQRPFDESLVVNAKGEEELEMAGKIENFDNVCSSYAHALLIDLLHLDLWAHKSFYRHFNHILYQRILQKYQAPIAEKKLKELLMHKLSTRDIEVILRDLE